MCSIISTAYNHGQYVVCTTIFILLYTKENPGEKLHKLKRVRPRDTGVGPSLTRGYFDKFRITDLEFITVI